jgi:citrate lyase subunit beta / citryl-CoA lyase
VRVPRSWLVVPAASPEALEAALDSGADAVVADLDRIAVAARAGARRALDRWLGDRAGRADGPALWARTSGGASFEDDVQVLVRHPLAGVLVSQAVNAALLVELDHILGHRPTVLAPVIETAVGLLNAGSLAAVTRVAHLVCGEDLLRTDLGVDRDADDRELASLRGHLVVVSAAFGKLAPIGPAPEMGASDDDVRRSSEEWRRAGYGGRLVRDPAHVAAVNEVFTVPPNALERAEQLVARYEKAVVDGEPLVDDDGLAVPDVEVNAAYRLLSRRP